MSLTSSSPAYLVVLGFALLLFASVRPHPALVTLAVLSPLLTALRLLPGIHVEALTIAAVAGAAIAAARRRRTVLRAQSPTVALPALLFAAAVTAIIGASSASWTLEATALSIVTARHARDGVMRPIHLLWATAIGGGIAVVFGRAYDSGGIGGVSTTLVGAVALVALLWMLVAAGVRVARGFRANLGDRVLIGALGALALLVVGWVAIAPLQTTGATVCPLAILLGATIARADGDTQPPL